MTLLFQILFWLVVFITSVLTVTASIGFSHWALDLTTHFRLQYFVLLFIALCLLWLGKSTYRYKRNSSLIIGVFISINIMAITPYYLPQERIESENVHKLSVLHLNIFAPNRQYSEIQKMIQALSPDIVEIQEYKDNSRNHLEKTGVFNNYPYRIVGKAHLGIYSKYPFRQSHLDYATGVTLANFATITTVVDVKGTPVNLITAHPHWPIMNNKERQRAHFKSWIDKGFTKKQNVVLLADLNTSPWSSNFKYLIRESGLKDSQLGKGIQPSWPVFIPHLRKYGRNLLVSLFRIPIDHILVSKDITVLKRELGPDVGSDHLPVYAELAIPVSSSR